MNKLVLASLLSLVPAASIADAADTQDYISSLDTQKLHQEVMDKVTKQVLEMNLKPLIDSEVAAQVKSKIDQKEKEDAWKFKRFTEKDWIDYDKKKIYEKVQNIMQDLEKPSTIEGLWDDASDEAVHTALRKFTIDFDLDTHKIDIKTKATDADGKPLFDWKLDPEAGQIDHIQRVPIMNPKKIISDHNAAIEAAKPQEVVVIESIQPVAAAPVAVEKHTTEIINSTPITPAAAPVAATAVPSAVPVAPASTAPAQVVDAYTTVKPDYMTDEEWAQLEEQRDLAYKIVYFFLVLIVATFGLLYVYYKMDQKEQQKEARQSREKGAFFGEIDKTTNFDFLGGQGESSNKGLGQSLNSTTFGQTLEQFDA